MDQDPLLKFLSTISSKIKIEKEYKSMMEEINNSSNTIVEKDPLRDVLGLLEQKIIENKPIIEDEIEEEIKVEVVQEPQSIVETTIENENTEIELSQKQNINEIVESNDTEADVFGDFINKLKNIVTSKNSSTSIEEETVTKEPVAPKKQTNDKKVAQVETFSEDNIDTSYINELDKISSDVANENEPGKVSEIKKLIQEYAEKYFKKASIMSSGGGGTMAYNYYNGGTIYGDLNVTGSYLSGGINLYNLLSGSGGGGGDPAVNSLVYSKSANWNSAYTNLTTNSAAYLSGADISLLASTSSNWNTAYTNLTTNSAAYLSSVDISLLAAASASWNDTQTTVQSNSSNWQTAYNSALYSVSGTDNQIVVTPSGTNNGDNAVTLSFASSAYFPGDVSVQGSLFLTGSATYINTQNLIVGDNLIYLNANNVGNLLDTGFVSHFTQAPLGYQHTGLVRKSGQGNPGTWTLFSGLTTEPASATNIDWNDPNLTLDSLSANIYASTGNSYEWTDAYTNLKTNSASWVSNYNYTNSNSANFILDGGNTKSTNITIGANNVNDLYLKTSNQNRAVVTKNGNVGIGKGVTTLASGDLFGYNFAPLINSSASAASPSLVNSLIIASDMNRSAGIGAFVSTQGWGSTTYNTAANITAAIANNEYYTISVYSNLSAIITISSIGSFITDRSNNGPSFIGLAHGTSSNPSFAQVVTAGVSVPLVLSDISPSFNTALQANPITIYPGTTGFIFLIPFGAGTTLGNLRFISTNPTLTANDLSFQGTIAYEPASLLDVNGVITAAGGNSNNWNNSYTTVQNNSATTWNYQGTDVKALTAKYESSWTVTSTNSANWNNTSSVVSSNSANWIFDGGNTKSANIKIGTNDNFNLALETNGADRITVLNTGNVGINTVSPNERLTVNGNISSNAIVYARTVTYPLTAIDFSTPGTTTYTLPDLTRYSWVKIICVGGGGGGGSGRKEIANGTSRYGGGGGGGGDYSEVTYPVSYISGNTTARVVVGAGGTGGAAQSTDATNGNNGTNGGASAVTFNTTGITVSALGGMFGYGGTTASGTGGQGHGIGGKGGDSSVTRAAREGTGTNIGGGAGGGGGGVSSGGTVGYDGGDAFPGGTIGGKSSLVPGGQSPAGAGGSASSVTQVSDALFVVCGTGGSGGGGARTGASNAGSGGNGAAPGGGGGGGGAVGVINFTTGAGGNGGAGLVRIVFY